MSEHIEIPKFETKKELFSFLIENKDKIIAQKKSIKKKADGFLHIHTIDNKGKLKANKANEPIDITNISELKVVAIINTTNFMDSHMDVHIPGLWKKSLDENKFIMFVQEHKSQDFNKIIADGTDLNPYTKFFRWSELGFAAEGETEALVFESTVKKSRNEFMFGQYANGFVKNHSVGMHYVKIGLAINDPDEVGEYELWEKYYPVIANKERADEQGYFWVVKEAKVVEGSAVPIGSNTITPTQSVTPKAEPIILTQEQKDIKTLKSLLKVMKEPQKNEPPASTHDNSTQKELEYLKSLSDILN